MLIPDDLLPFFDNRKSRNNAACGAAFAKPIVLPSCDRFQWLPFHRRSGGFTM
jgi:hypothetical protein